MRFFKAHGWTRVAMITTTDANGQDLTQGYGELLALPEFRTMQSFALEHFNETDRTVDAQIARIKAAAPQALIAWVAGTPVTHAIHDSGRVRMRRPRGLSDRNALMFVWDPANASMVAVSKAGGTP
jgi:branched-chain amino acid transport system substrate-binding protein